MVCKAVPLVCNLVTGRRSSATNCVTIDYSDLPPTTAKQWQGAEVGHFYHPAKEQITVQVDADVVVWLKAQGRDYQARVNELLRQVMLRDVKH